MIHLELHAPKNYTPFRIEVQELHMSNINMQLAFAYRENAGCFHHLSHIILKPK